MDDLAARYQDYRSRLDGISTREDIAAQGFRIIENQIFPVTAEAFGDVFLVPALEEKYNRLALFWVREDGSVVFHTDQLAANNRYPGELAQPNRGVLAVSFQDLNLDGLTDIVLITTSAKETAFHGEKEAAYKVGDVLFQSREGFYQDYRLSDKINRFSMNKSVKSITSFVEGENSAEFLYTSATLKELKEHGLLIASEQSTTQSFEKLGELLVVPGTYRMAEYTVFMVYLINEQGNIVWSFQPMGNYESLYALYGVACRDIDGDGLKDLTVLARYSQEADDGEQVLYLKASVYYQKTGGFYEDREIMEQLFLEDDCTMEELIKRARACWGWSADND